MDCSSDMFMCTSLHIYLKRLYSVMYSRASLMDQRAAITWILAGTENNNNSKGKVQWCMGKIVKTHDVILYLSYVMMAGRRCP